VGLVACARESERERECVCVCMWMRVVGGQRIEVSGEGYKEIARGDAYRLYMSETMSISASACAIFCSDESCGRPPKRKDIVCVGGVGCLAM
jgi:hypothetical protein